MKYSITTIVLLLLLYVTTLMFGLYVADTYTEIELPYGIQSPEVPVEYSVPYFAGSVILVTLIFLILQRYSFNVLLRMWYYLAVFLAITIAVSPFVGEVFAALFAVIIIVAKMFGENLFVHNLAEVFIYAGIVPLFAPIFNLTSVVLLIIAMGVYDFIAVFKTKHMIKLAKSQQKAGIFSGLIVRYRDEVSILGGGDIAFPLLFASVANEAVGTIPAVFSIYGATLGLLALIIVGKEKKYYPALPFIAFGLFAGFLLGRLL